MINSDVLERLLENRENKVLSDGDWCEVTLTFPKDIMREVVQMLTQVSIENRVKDPKTYLLSLKVASQIADQVDNLD
jgi:hypothetical protein